MEMSEQPVVSVVMPAYNYGHFIGATLNSLQAQTFSNWECVVVDDGSTDNTAEVVAEFVKTDPRIKFLQQPNRRQAAARNYGLAHISGKYVQFLDADDLIQQHKFERQVEFLEAHDDVDIVYSDTRYFATERPDELLYTMYGENKPWQPQLSGLGLSLLPSLIRHNSVIVCAPLTRRTLIERVGRFEEELPPLEAWYYWIRCALLGANFKFVDFADSFCLVRSHATSSSKNRFRWTAAEIKLRRKLTPLLAKYGKARRLNAQLLVEAQGTLGAQQVMSGHRLRGAYYLSKAALFDRKFRQRLKWLACALAAPVVSPQRFDRVYSGSISRGIL
jgi:glycosyltransferase involved in cell wall biosynthesis